MDESRKKNANGAFEGAIGISSFTPTIEFEEKYKRRYGMKPDFNSDTSYDAMMLLAKAIEESKSTEPSVVADWISKRTHYDGVSGNLTFTSIRTVTKPSMFQIVVNDTITEYRVEDSDSKGLILNQ